MAEQVVPTPGAPALAKLVGFSEDVILSSQPSIAQLQNLHLMGIKSVLNMRCEDEKGFIAQEPSYLAQQNIRYALHPIRTANDIDAAYVDKGLQLIQELPKPVLVHCAAGLTAAMLSCIDQAKKQGATSTDVCEWGMALGYNFANQAGFYSFLQKYMEGKPSS